MIYLALLRAAVSLHAATPEIIDPVTTTVALLPTVNISGDKHINLKKEQVKESDATLLRLFSERRFVVLSSEITAKAIADAKLDLTDEENFRKELLYDLGNELKVDLLVFNVITGTRQQKRSDFFENLEGYATMRTWVLDVKNRTPYLRGDTYEGVSSKNGSVGFGRQVRAVRLGLQKQLEGFLKPFPVTEK